MKYLRFLLVLIFPTLSLAQTVPNGGITQGQVWTVPQWLTAWQSKADTASPALTGSISVTGTGSGAYTTVPFSFVESESFLAPGAFHIAGLVQDTRANGSGNREAMTINMISGGATAGDQIVGLKALGQITSGSGSAFGSNPYAWINAGSATNAEAVGEEADTDVRNASVNRKVGIQIVDVATSTGTGSIFDAGLIIGKQAGAAGYANGLQFGFSATSGLKSTSTLIAAPYAFTVGNGIDFSALTISTNAFKSPGFILSGTGVMSVGSPTVGQNFSLGVKQVTNGQPGLYLQRLTDTAPTGNLLQVTNAANNVVLMSIDALGNIVDTMETLNPASGNYGLIVNGAAATQQLISLVGASSNGATIRYTDGNAGNRIFLAGVGITAVGAWEVFDQTASVSRFKIDSGGATTIAAPTSGVGLTVNNVAGSASIVATGAIQLPVTTVAALPTCNAGAKGQLYAVSDATAPTYNAALTGGGAVSVPVYCNGSAWTSH